MKPRIILYIPYTMSHNEATEYAREISRELHDRYPESILDDHYKVLAAPKTSQQMSDEKKSVLKRFIAQYVTVQTGAYVSKTSLHDQYLSFCNESRLKMNQTYYTQKAFAFWLIRSIPSVDIRGNRDNWLNIRLKKGDVR